MGALDGYRVIDLTVARGWMCGRVLADLGAEVIKVEPPGGDPGRRAGLFADPNAPDPEGSLSWWHENRGKRSVVLDLDDPADRDRFLGLAEGADAVIESFPTGWLGARGLEPEALHARNPHLVITSISGFGRTGPYAGWSATDLTVAATTAELWLTGDTDRAPVRLSSPQLFLHAGVEAAVHTLVALWHAQHTGEGQDVDVSAQLAGMKCLMNAQAYHLIEGRELFRQGSWNNAGRSKFRIITPCLDGHAAVLVAAGAIGGPMMRFLVDWAEREGVADPLVIGRDWSTLNFLDEPLEFYEATSDTLTRLFARHTKAELYQAALDHLLLVAPVNTVADLRVDEQLTARGYFVPVDVDAGVGAGPAWGTVHHPGPWAKLSATPLDVQRRAPRIGEDTEAVLAAAARRPRAAAVDPDGRARPFEGLKVLDLAWVGVGPMTAGYLGSYGAEVIKIESSKRPDVLRLTNPLKDGRPGINNSHFYGDFNAGKRCIGIDLTDPRGREVAWKLVEWADVVVESFTPKALAGWGMDYAAIRARKPSIVMLSTCMQGQTGPRRFYRGFGNLMGALAGFYEITGWPDRDPAMIYGAYTDFVSQRFTTSALIAALDHRRRTGEGQHIDLAQLEASLQFLGAEFLAYEIDGRVATRCGNRDRDLVPNGVFPCLASAQRVERFPDGGPGAEGWVAISCADDAQWAALVARAGLPDEPQWHTAAGRRADEDRIEALIGAWTATRTAADVVAALQPAVACAPVHGVPELHTDPQIAHREYWVPHEHPVYGRVPYSGMQARLSRTPGEIRGPAPCLGQHTWEVLEEVLGYDPDVIAELLATDVVEITG
ncbi:MAG: CaiB/BaiF CoA transferase family protein [Acidimicrobiales bacterium]